METPAALAALSALAHEARLEVFRLLVGAGPDGEAAGEIARRVGLSPPTLSFHLRLLSHARLVTARRDGRSVRYAASFETMGRLINYLTENCCAQASGACATGCAQPVPARVPKKVRRTA